jgi:hypothetical protein
VQRAFVRAELIRRLQHDLVRPELARDPPLFADRAHVPFPTAQAPKKKDTTRFDECGSDTSEAERLNIFKLSLPAFRCLLY